jgi:apolipoprotein N-acyltransferase
LMEWVRGWIFTGFPWNTIGYSQMVASPLAGYAPVLGIFGVSLALAAMAGCVALLGARWSAAKPRHRTRALLRHPAPYVFVILALGGSALKAVSWTEPTGTTTTVSLLQGNVAQDMKWREDQLIMTLRSYLAQVRASRAQLIVLPETALPLFLHQVPPDYLDALREQAVRNDGDILIGVTEREPDGRYYNSAVSLGISPTQKYRKSHLVPFGEFIPLRPLLAWIVNVLVIPLQDFSRGAIDQQPLAIAGQRVAVNICYEDAFGEEITRQLPQATLLVNISNVAWFGRSLAPEQHLQISQARALETGRYMLRATNTGMTAVIDQRGHVLSIATPFTMARVDYTVPGYKGTTPYAHWGNSFVVLIDALMMLLALRATLAKMLARGMDK